MKLQPMTIPQLREAYLQKKTTPTEWISQLLERIRSEGERPIWIRVLSAEELQPYLKRI
jgi:hypothetical protein